MAQEEITEDAKHCVGHSISIPQWRTRGVRSEDVMYNSVFENIKVTLVELLSLTKL